MGLDLNSVQFLLHCKKKGVNFSQSAVLGRQIFQTSKSSIASKLTAEGLNPPALDSFPFADEFFHSLGAKKLLNVDASDYEGADIVLDLNEPLSDKYNSLCDVVIDGGTLEHVFNYPVALKNVMRMTKVGGHVISITPTNNFGGHGFYQFSPELFFRVFSEENGFEAPLVLYRELGYFSSWKKIVDPDKLQRRVLRRRGRPALLYVCSKKLEQKDIFSVVPQQSDYATKWSNYKEFGDSSSSTWINSIGNRLPLASKKMLVQFKSRYFKGPMFDKKAYVPYKF